MKLTSTRMSEFGCKTFATSKGTAPAFTTHEVCSWFPVATINKISVASETILTSNSEEVFTTSDRKETIWGRTRKFKTSSIGGESPPFKKNWFNSARAT